MAVQYYAISFGTIVQEVAHLLNQEPNHKHSPGSGQIGNFLFVLVEPVPHFAVRSFAPLSGQPVLILRAAGLHHFQVGAVGFEEDAACQAAFVAYSAGLLLAWYHLVER
jgi:hypothetical protein